MQRPPAASLSRPIAARAAAITFVAAMVSACAIHLREAVPDAPKAIVAATQLCGWAPADHTDHLHAELSEDKWHVWDDRGGAEAYLNRFDTRGTYLCISL